MNLWIRSTAKTNLLQARFLTIMEGKNFYKKSAWEYEGYTICNVNLNGNYEILGTYKTKERALEVLDEIQTLLEQEDYLHIRKSSLNTLDDIGNPKYILKSCRLPKIYEMPKE